MKRIDLFFEKVTLGDETECWWWQAAVDRKGYGLFWNGRKSAFAHRYIYEEFVAPIPDGLVIDHLCCEPSCVNPAHMEVVTSKENSLRGNGATAMNARKTHCKRGHEFTDENTYFQNPNSRTCRQCVRDRQRRAYALLEERDE